MSIFQQIADKLLSSGSKDSSAPLDKISEPGDQSPDDEKLVQHIKEKIDQVRQANSRIALEGTYLTNVAYLMGFDGVYFDTNYRQFKNIDSKRRITRNRFKVNKILPLAQNRLSRLTQSPPRFDVRPNSNSTEDKDASRLALQVIENVFDRQRFDEKRHDLTMAAMQGGVAYIQVLWDPSLGKPMINPETNQIEDYEGDIRIEVLNALEVFPDPLAKNIDDCQWLIKAKVRKLDYFKNRYPDRGEAVKEESAWLLSSIYDLKTNAITSTGMAGASHQDQMKNSAIELVYYEKRSKEHPNGRMIVCASGILLEDKELPIGQYDIVKFDDIKVGGRFYAESVITHARPIQDHYNILRTKIADWIKKMLAGKYIAAKGSELGQESLTNDSGEVMLYTPVPNASEPHALVIPQIPPYVFKEIEVADKELDYVFGINEISRGVLPSASIPASGMAFLQEQDQTRIGVQTTSNENGYSRVAECVLKYVSEYYVMPRLLKEAGDGLEYAVKDFVGADIKNNHDVICITGSTIPTSKVLRRQDIINAMQMGLLGDPADPKVRAKVLAETEFGDVAEVWKSQAMDEGQYKKVLVMIENGDEVGVHKSLNMFDNHQFHLKEMNDYRKSDKFDNLDEEKQKLFMFVMEWRLNALVGIANPQIPQQTQLAEEMVKSMHENFGGAAQPHPGGLGAPPPPTAQIDANGNVVAPPMAQAPVPNQTNLPQIQRGV